GGRFRLGARTNEDFSENWQLEGHVAYGTKDGKFKYGLGFRHFLGHKNPRHFFGASYTWDVEQLGQGENAWRNDNILTSIFRTQDANRLNGFERIEGFYDREWFNGFTSRLTYKRRKIWPLGDLRFERNTGDGTGVTPVENIVSSEVIFHSRFAYKERFFESKFNRFSLGSKYPIVQAQFTLGMEGIWGGDYDYRKLVVNVRNRVNVNPFGSLEYLIEGGQIWGNVPFPLLELHNGNVTLFYDPSAFNLMNLYEFASDRYASVSLTHHFNGLFLNKIPLMRKLKWREVATVKGVVGTLRDENRATLNFPETLDNLDEPYYEVGLGIENILKLFRID
ncbi:MAG: DUF5686 family protein, partial [Bacteroidota bacterium]